MQRRSHISCFAFPLGEQWVEYCHEIDSMGACLVMKLTCFGHEQSNILMDMPLFDLL